MVDHLLFHEGQCIKRSHRFPVRTVRRQGIKHIGQGADLPVEVNLIPSQLLGIPCAVESFVMLKDNGLTLLRSRWASWRSLKPEAGVTAHDVHTSSSVHRPGLLINGQIDLNLSQVAMERAIRFPDACMSCALEPRNRSLAIETARRPTLTEWVWVLIDRGS